MNKLRVLVLAAALALALPVAAWADSFNGSDGWEVTYTSAGEMEDNYSDSEFADSVLSQLQPGDDITFKVTLNHENATDADWYMSNEVRQSLEDDGGKNSAYEYLLKYNDETLYDSQAVGGDDTTGLSEATDAMEDYLYLDTLSKGDTGLVTLKVTLDGETEGNDYFNTLAKLQMNFAVEPVVENPGEDKVITKTKTNVVNRTVVRTGDENDLFPFFVAMAISGALLALFAFDGVRRRRNEREEA